MLVSIELTVPCNSIEEILKNQYRLEGPVTLTDFDRDDLSDVLGFTFELEAEDSKKICRDWDDYSLATEVMGEAI